MCICAVHSRYESKHVSESLELSVITFKKKRFRGHILLFSMYIYFSYYEQLDYLHILLIRLKNLVFIKNSHLTNIPKICFITKFKSKNKVVLNSDFCIMVTSYTALNSKRMLIIYKEKRLR